MTIRSVFGGGVGLTFVLPPRRQRRRWEWRNHKGPGGSKFSVYRQEKLKRRYTNCSSSRRCIDTFLLFSTAFRQVSVLQVVYLYLQLMKINYFGQNEFSVIFRVQQLNLWIWFWIHIVELSGRDELWGESVWSNATRLISEILYSFPSVFGIASNIHDKKASVLLWWRIYFYLSQRTHTEKRWRREACCIASTRIPYCTRAVNSQIACLDTLLKKIHCFISVQRVVV